MAKKTKQAAKKKPVKKSSKTAAKAKKSSAKATPSFSDTTILKRSTDVLARRNADGTVAVLRLDSDDSFYTIDRIAAEFWALIDDKSSIEQIKAKLVKRYQPPEARFNRDVQALVSELLREKLIRT